MDPLKHPILRNTRGSILIFCLWTVGFLSFLALSISGLVKQEILVFKRLEERATSNRAAEAAIYDGIRYLNQMGVGARTSIQDIDSINKYLQGEMGGVDYWVGAISDEKKAFLDLKTNSQISAVIDYYDQNQTLYGIMDHNRRVNINRLNRHTLRLIFEKIAKLEKPDAARMAAMVMDYRDIDDHVSALTDGTGSEKVVYEKLHLKYGPKNSDYEFKRELLRVPGMTEEIYRRIESVVTVYGDGAVNANTASAQVLGLLDLSDSLIQKILQFRVGENGLPGDEDDRSFSGASAIERELSAFYKLNESERVALRHVVARRQLDVRSNVFEIVARAERSGSAYSEITCIYQLNKGILAWIEG